MQRLITKNKKAYFDYEILTPFEAGIELKGYEVKALKDGKVNLKGSFISIQNNDLLLKGCHISPLSSLPKNTIESKRERKLFIHKKDIFFLSSKIKEAGKTIIPLEMYFSGNLIKLKIALVQGKKKYDKKQTLKERSMDMEARIQMKKFI
ncbi:SsrA-binding protein SmpB [Candidatus Gracilibacteria bacterium]|nr:SsrA-binding protein SmpB [Candidatus Gracilibacteria bacterium]NUJ98601.1 SsrA-binding protein SmpB [Candidatus Gracilibacteria bacterium]